MSLEPDMKCTWCIFWFPTEEAAIQTPSEFILKHLVEFFLLLRAIGEGTASMV